MKDMPELKTFLDNVSLYKKELKALNLKDHDVKSLKMNFCIIVYNFIYSVFAIIFYLSFALIGLAILEPMGIYNSIVGEQTRKVALAGSVVKVVGVDVIASQKLISTFKIFPVLCIISSTIYYFYFSEFLGGDSVVQRLMHTFMFFLFCPIYAYLCILARDNLGIHFRVLKSRFYCFFYTEHVMLIQGMRNNLKKAIREFINKKGPELFNDFDEVKKKQMNMLYSDNKSSKSRQEALDAEVDEALEDLREIGI